MKLELNNVSKTIRKHTVIDQVSFTANSGEIVGLKGINGSGKTMLMRLISGLILPTSGCIIIDNKVLGKHMIFPESIGILIEEPAFLDGYTGFHNLKLIASIKNIISDETIRKTLLLVGLDPDDKRKYKKYSLGMKKRLGIAAAIMEQPTLLLLDEPMNALDEDGIELIKQIISQEKQRGAIVILTCHDSLMLQDLSDTIYEIVEGELVNTIICEQPEKVSCVS